MTRDRSLSRLPGPGRLPDMERDFAGWRRVLTAAVVVHLVIAIVHGVAHSWAHVPLSHVSMLFVIVVILGGPLAGLWLTVAAPRAGTWLVALSLGAALIFGVVNHFAAAGPDHVSSVTAEWRPLFASTAWLLAITEALGSALAFRLALDGA